MTSAVKKEWIPSFGGLRFLMVLLLIFHHFDMYQSLAVPQFDAVMRYLTEGAVCVSFFFILSGFVIQYSYGDKIIYKQISPLKFILYRLAHLWPIHALMISICGITYFRSVDFFTQPSFYSYFFLLQSIVPLDGFAFGYNGSSWAVSSELFFYIFFCFAVELHFNKKIALLCISLICTVFGIFYIGDFSPLSNWLFYVSPITRFSEFLIGMILCEMYLKKTCIPSSTLLATVLELTSFAILIAFCFIAARYNVSYAWKWQVWYIFPSAFLIYIFSSSKGLLSKAISGKNCQLAGELAYPIFMTHQYLLYLTKNIFFSDNFFSLPKNTFSILSVGIFTVFLSVVTGYILLKYFCRPINFKMRRLIDKFIYK